MQTWTLDWAIRNFIAELLMPPGIWSLISLSALFFLRHRQLLQRTLLVFALMMIWVSSTPAFAAWFTHQMDSFLHWPKPVQISGLPHHQQSSNQSVLDDKTFLLSFKIILLCKGNNSIFCNSPANKGINFIISVI
jgi:hypothetical protein